MCSPSAGGRDVGGAVVTTTDDTGAEMVGMGTSSCFLRANGSGRGCANEGVGGGARSCCGSEADTDGAVDTTAAVGSDGVGCGKDAVGGAIGRGREAWKGGAYDAKDVEVETG